MALIAISASLERVKRVAQLVADSDHAPATRRPLRASLGVREGNEQALTAYLSMGMRLFGESMPEVDRPTNVILVMECDLGPARKSV